MILVVNAGSSSVKVALFDPSLRELLRGSVSEIGGEGRLRLGSRDEPASAPDHDVALALLLRGIEGQGHALSDLTAAAHRVVHGGATFTTPCRVTPQAIASIEACVRLAPLHNPGNLAGIRALQALAPALPQFASFDTAFHSSLPEVEQTYALPEELRAAGLRRYGFHGLSYASLTEHLAERSLLPRRLLAFHLGNGSSACAILDGRSVATTMGYSPLEGLVMGSRSGSIDGMAVLEMARRHGIDTAEAILNSNSGLKALGGTSDMQTLLARDDASARFAVEHYCYWAVRQGAALAGAMGGIDDLAFTGGIGEHATAVRERIEAGLAFLAPARIHVVPAQEERRIAADALSLLVGA